MNNKPKEQRVKMERLFAFLDATVAIIMTILVLEIKWPHEPTLEGFWHIRYSLLAYAVSFLIVFSVWRGSNLDFANVKTVGRKSINALGFMLFVMSITPFTTNFYVEHMDKFAPTLAYSITFALFSFTAFKFYAAVQKDNPNDNQIYDDTEPDLRDLVVIVGTIAGFLIIFVRPEWVLWSQILVSTVYNIPEQRFPWIGIHVHDLFKMKN
jgi:uncharacterized membrane protein